METLIHWDIRIFHFINQTMGNDFMDTLLPLIRNRYIWIPVYIAIITYIFHVYHRYKAYYYLIFIILAISLTDLTAGNILKKLVQRERPCQLIEFSSQINERVHCSYSYSFPSAHAANHFGLSLILWYLLVDYERRWGLALFLWAALIAFAQVYVGVHYPLDVLAGALLGYAIVRSYIFLIHPIVDRLRNVSFD